MAVVLAVLQLFLQNDLSQESLSQHCEEQRHNACNTIEAIIKKINHAHPSIRPRVNTPAGGGKKPPLPPPAFATPPIPLPEEQEELYEEPLAAETQPAEDYLSFEPTNALTNGVAGEEEPQEMYEAMENQDLYEEPGMWEGPGMCVGADYRMLGQPQAIA